MEGLLRSSFSCFADGIKLFEQISDNINSALLLSNKGRLMRLYAQAYTQNTMGLEKPEFSSKERQYYNKVTVLLCVIPTEYELMHV